MATTPPPPGSFSHAIEVLRDSYLRNRELVEPLPAVSIELSLETFLGGNFGWQPSALDDFSPVLMTRLAALASCGVSLPADYHEPVGWVLSDNTDWFSRSSRTPATYWRQGFVLVDNGRTRIEFRECRHLPWPRRDSQSYALRLSVRCEVAGRFEVPALYLNADDEAVWRVMEQHLHRRPGSLTHLAWLASGHGEFMQRLPRALGPHAPTWVITRNNLSEQSYTELPRVPAPGGSLAGWEGEVSLWRRT